MTIETRLAEIRARVDAAADLGVGSILHALISTTHAPALLAAVETVRELHRPVEVEPSETICAECSTLRGQGETARYFPFTEYPCPTVRDITTALEVQG